MGWPLVVVIVIVVIGIAASLSSVVAGNASVEAEKAKGQNGEQYRLLSADYEKLAQETRDNVKTIHSDLATLREKVDSIEKMMREVG